MSTFTKGLGSLILLLETREGAEPMGCFGVAAGLALPRVAMVILWIFTDYLGRAYDGVIVPLLGFFFLPTTTLTYAIAQNETGGVEGWGVVWLAIGIALDLGIWGNGRGIFNRDHS